MVYIIIFIIMCWLDWKLDTYAAFKFFGSFLFIGIAFILGQYQKDLTQFEIGRKETSFISYQIVNEQRSINSSEQMFVYLTEKDSFQSIEMNKISKTNQGQEKNEVLEITYSQPKIIKVLFFTGNSKKYEINLK